MADDQTVDAVLLDGWRINAGYPEDKAGAERQLSGEDPSSLPTTMSLSRLPIRR